MRTSGWLGGSPMSLSGEHKSRGPFGPRPRAPRQAAHSSSEISSGSGCLDRVLPTSGPPATTHHAHRHGAGGSHEIGGERGSHQVADDNQKVARYANGDSEGRHDRRQDSFRMGPRTRRGPHTDPACITALAQIGAVPLHSGLNERQPLQPPGELAQAFVPALFDDVYALAAPKCGGWGLRYRHS